MTETPQSPAAQESDRPPTQPLPQHAAVVGAVDAEGKPVDPATLRPSLDLSPTSAPSATRTVDDLAQVMVDQWGHRGEFVRGMIIRLADLNPAHYDHEHALRMGVIRLLTEAEARVWAGTASATSPTNPDGSLDEDHQRYTRESAGIPTETPETVTGEQGQAEPAEFAKPTLAYSGDNAPSPRPVRTRGKDEG